MTYRVDQLPSTSSTVCEDCGSVVADIPAHNHWHAEVERHADDIRDLWRRG